MFSGGRGEGVSLCCCSGQGVIRRRIHFWTVGHNIVHVLAVIVLPSLSKTNTVKIVGEKHPWLMSKIITTLVSGG